VLHGVTQWLATHDDCYNLQLRSDLH